MNIKLTKHSKSLLFGLCLIAICCMQSSAAKGDQNSDQSFCSMTAVEEDLLRLTNLSRASGQKCGRKKMRRVSELKYDCNLAKMAKQHVLELHERKVLSHQSADGSSLSDRANKMEISWRALAENISNGYQTAEAAHNGWLNSTPHCKNIMTKTYNTLGMAEHEGFWVVVFANK